MGVKKNDLGNYEIVKPTKGIKNKEVDREKALERRIASLERDRTARVQPRGMTKHTAAEYVGARSGSAFYTQWKKGRWPDPIDMNTRPYIWDRLDLDRYLDRAKDTEENDDVLWDLSIPLTLHIDDNVKHKKTSTKVNHTKKLA